MSEHGETLNGPRSVDGQNQPDESRRERGLKAQMRLCGMRPLIRKTGLSQHTIEKILAALAVRPMTLQRVIAALRPE